MTNDQHDAGGQRVAKDAHVQVLAAEVRTPVAGWWQAVELEDGANDC